ncbi:hypothetical protein C6496_12995 [Candidatus Poribacteria bacterium]|nr:MAG: hypothetical protein C6496_12995 [Candidatus Poribacteria bacterium]
MPQTGTNRAAARITTGFEIVRKTQFLFLNLIVSILIVLLTLTGCSDAPYIGSMLTVDDVDRYITSTEDSICLENRCIVLMSEATKRADGIVGPIIHIHPNNFSYIIYRMSLAVSPAETVKHPIRGFGVDGDGVGDDGIGGVPVTTPPDDVPLQGEDGVGEPFVQLDTDDDLNDGTPGSFDSSGDGEPFVQLDTDDDLNGGTPGGDTLGDNTDGKGSSGNGGDTCTSGYVVWVNDKRSVGGFLSSGVICGDYLYIDSANSMLIFTGSDGVVDGGENETTEEYVTVETGYTYEEASDRAPEILREY